VRFLLFEILDAANSLRTTQWKPVSSRDAVNYSSTLMRLCRLTALDISH